MKLTKFFLVSFFCMTSILATARPSTKITDETVEKKIENTDDASPSDESSEQTSADNREKHPFNPALRFGIMGGFPVSGLEASFLTSNQWQLGLMFVRGSLDFKDRSTDTADSIETKKFDASIALADLRARYFLGNSFFLHGGLGYRTISYDLQLVAKTTGDFLNVKGTSKSIVFTPGIGNIWTYDFGLSFGVEWLSVSIPLTNAYSSSSSTSVTTLGTSTLQDTEASNEKIAKTLGKATIPQLLMFHVGWAF